MRHCKSGRRRSKPSMSKRLPAPSRNSIPVCLRANSTACAWHNNTPSSGVSGSSASRMPTRPPHNTPYANGSNSFYPNSLSSWRCLGFLPTTTSPNEVSALWSSLARSAAAHAVPMAQRLAWVWPLYLEPGWPNISILSASALPCCPPHLLWVNSELYRTVIIVVLVLLVLCGGAAAYSYYYFEANIQKPLSTMIHPVQRAKEEPQLATPIPTDSAVSGRVWNILLLGSDNDQKFNFPDVLTQVLMVVHIDTIHDTVMMLSIPRDSWVYVPEVGGMHKIDQAFLLGAEQHNSFDNGVQLARLTIEKDYGISIDRYAWVGLSGFVKAIDTLGGVNIDVTHPIVDDTYPEDTGSSGYIYTDISEQELLGFALFG